MPEGPAFFQAIQRLTTVNWGGTRSMPHKSNYGATQSYLGPVGAKNTITGWLAVSSSVGDAGDRCEA
jgi:hypothetical protein